MEQQTFSIERIAMAPRRPEDWGVSDPRLTFERPEDAGATDCWILCIPRDGHSGRRV